jgi:hypothetical protein
MINPLEPKEIIVMASRGFLPKNRTIVYSGGDM